MRTKYFKILFALVWLSIIIVSCTKVNKDDIFPPGDVPPVAGGFSKADEVAEKNLLAYWNFDGTLNESKSNAAPITQKNNSFITGVKGQALNLDQGYLLYPTIAAISGANTFPSFTISAWVNVANNGSQASCFFSLTEPVNAQTDWGSPINFGIQTGRPITTNNLTFDTWFATYIAGVRNGQDNINDFGEVGKDFQLVAGANQWIQYLARYDAAQSTIDMYVNNIRISNNNFRMRSIGGSPMGALVFPSAPAQVLIGAFPNANAGYPNSLAQVWQGQLKGSIDELRVYNKALSDIEIAALYKLEKEGR